MNLPDIQHSGRWKPLLIVFVILQIFAVAGCSHRARSTAAPGFSVALLTPGPVSDAGWNAAAYQGLELIKTKLGARTALVQTTSPADFEDSFRDFASRGFVLV